MKNRLYQILEFEAVLEDLAGRTHCPVSADEIRKLKPPEDDIAVTQRLREISEIRTFMDSGGTFPTGRFDDIRNLFHAASVPGSHLDPDAFRSLHGLLTLSKRLRGFFKEHQSDFPTVREISAGLDSHLDLVRNIERVFDLSSLEVQDRASPTLKRLRRQLADARDHMQRLLNRLTESLAKRGVLQEHLVTVRSGRWVLPVKETHRHLVKGVLHDRSASGATAFLEPLETVEPNNRIRQIESEVEHEIERILVGLTDAVRAQLPALKTTFKALVALDCLHAKALTSKQFDQHEPAISSSGSIKLTDARHPLLILKRHADRAVVPLSIAIGKVSNTLVITGPNAGGKTVALKTLGLLALMVSCGLHIPAGPDSEVPLFGKVFAHIGDDQSIENDLSTFSAHLKGIKTILEEAGPQDLVLIDEIGAGTDPQEGAALAMAVLEELTGRGTLTVVTSHHGALKAFAHETPGVANGSMAFDSRTLTPTYRFRHDLPGSSYAFEIAKRIGLKEAVVHRSKVLMDTETNRLEDLLIELERQVALNQARQAELESERARAESMRRELSAKHDSLVRNEKALRKAAVEKASAVLAKANSAVQDAVSTVRQQLATKAAIQDASRIIDREKAHLKAERTSLFSDDGKDDKGRVLETVRPGDRVLWKRGGKAGTVLTAPETDGRTLVAFDTLKVHVPLRELSTSDVGPGRLEPRQSAVKRPVVEAESRIDLRGLHVEDALEAVDKFLDNALLSGLLEVEIIHGVGTGALRNNLIPFLDQHPLVESITHGPRERENPGMTIVRISDSRSPS